MDRTLRCTVCPWRGAWSDAATAPRRLRRAELAPIMADIQAAYEEKQASSVHFGMIHEPPCPKCGHHTVAVRRTPSFHPSM